MAPKKLAVIEPSVNWTYCRVYYVLLAEPDQLRPIDGSVVRDNRRTFNPSAGADADGQPVVAQLCTYGNFRWWVPVEQLA